MNTCTRCGRPAQRALCWMCQNTIEMERRQAPRSHINPLTRVERDKAREAEAQHGA